MRSAVRLIIMRRWILLGRYDMADSYVALDLEMTGLKPREDRIIEIGAVKVIDGKAAESFSTLINPRMELPERITEITGICQQELEDAPDIEDVLEPLSDFMGNLPLLGHRILFDYSFLKRAMINHKFSFEKRGIDTLALSRKYLPELPSKRLEDMCLYYRIPQQAHRAMEDARAAHLLYGKIKQQFLREDNRQDFEPRQLIYKVKKEAPASEKQKKRLSELIEKHKLVIDVEIQSMTKNEVSRLTDKILAKYGR